MRQAAAHVALGGVIVFLTSMIAAVSLVAQGGDTSLADVLAGKAAPLTIVATELPADFVAVEIQTATGGGGGFESLLMSPLMMLGPLMGGQESDGPPADVVAALTAVWTRGQVLRVDGQSFYVTYGYSLVGATSSQEPPKVLQLKLIKVDSVTSIKPLGKLSPDLSAFVRPQTATQIPPAGASDPELVFENEISPAESPPAQPIFLSPEEAVSTEGRAARHSAMKALLLRTEMSLSETKNVFPYVQSTASMYGILANVRAAAMPPSTFYRIAACPRDGVRFLFNMSLAGTDAGTLPNGASLPVWYEQDPDLDGNRIVGLLNGSTRLVNSADWSASYATLLRKSYRKPPGSSPLPPDYAVSGLPDWLRK